jgi:pimeloyl-ACP methyl ester carboxylesterase
MHTLRHTRKNSGLSTQAEHLVLLGLEAITSPLSTFVTQHALIIWGAQDGVVSTAHAQAYLRGIAGAELVVLPRCGHLPLAEQPEACVNAVLSFLARLGS